MRLHGSENTAPSVPTPSSHRNSTHLSLPTSTGSCFLQDSFPPLNLPYPIQPERTADSHLIGRVNSWAWHLHLICTEDAACVQSHLTSWHILPVLVCLCTEEWRMSWPLCIIGILQNQLGSFSTFALSVHGGIYLLWYFVAFISSEMNRFIEFLRSPRTK
jgi:hypothetical protein